MVTSRSSSGPRDPNTLSNYHDFVTRHISASLDIDFGQKAFKGNVVLELDSLNDGDKQEIILDSSHVDVQQVTVNDKEAQWKLDPPSVPYGSAMRVFLAKGVPRGTSVRLQITLSTTEKCTALQWLTPAMTVNKKHPYMFSQCQAIHARSIFPCQDTPDVKSTVNFNIRSPLPVLASGLPTGTSQYLPPTSSSPATLLYTFSQSIPIPSYLFAVASGDLASASIGPRSTVWTSPESLIACQWELSRDTETFIDAAESLIYPYAWTTYNVLVLPPSFPYGGMENPVFTFATPTIISGDRQNVDVIAHELSHSWSGNLVSNASWEHFWLNEGWTTYLERRIIGKVHGEAHLDFSALLGQTALNASIERFGAEHEFTKLVPSLENKDPDDSFSSIPYEKGFTFLYHLEHVVGRETWDKFIPHYFTKYRQKSLTTPEFLTTLLDFFSSDKEASAKLSTVDFNRWLYAPGYPPVLPKYDTSLADVCYLLASKWEPSSDSVSSHGFRPSKSDIAGLTANQIVLFLETIINRSPPHLTATQAEVMGDIYGFAGSKNVEITSRYFTLGMQSRYSGVYPDTERLLGQVGRMKFVRPLYRGLLEVDRPRALRCFEKNKDFYHPICRQMVEKDIDASGA